VINVTLFSFSGGGVSGVVYTLIMKQGDSPQASETGIDIMTFTKEEAMAAVEIVKAAMYALDKNGAISVQSAIQARTQLIQMGSLLEMRTREAPAVGTLPCGTYLESDRALAATFEEAKQWINIYTLHGMMRKGKTIHDNKALADLYFQIDADCIDLDLEADGVFWIGAVEYRDNDE